jgi:hypothetical protein
MNLINTFVRSIEQLVEGVPDANGLLQTLRRPRDEFKKAIRHTAPCFLPRESFLFLEAPSTVPPFSFLSSEETWEEEPCDASSPIFIDAVLQKADS